VFFVSESPSKIVYNSHPVFTSGIVIEIHGQKVWHACVLHSHAHSPILLCPLLFAACIIKTNEECFKMLYTTAQKLAVSTFCEIIPLFSIEMIKSDSKDCFKIF